MTRGQKILINFVLLLLLITLIFYSCKQKPTETPVLETKITGKVTDKSSSSEIADASVTTIPTTSSVTTDANGNYTISDVSPRQYLVTATKEGYKSSSINVIALEGKTVYADIQLQLLVPELAVSISSIDFGTTQTTTSFIISNKTAVGSVVWTFSIGVPWLSPLSNSGTVTTGTNTVTLNVNRSGLSYGNYNTVLTITSNGGNKDIPISMTVQNPNAPQLTVSPLQINFTQDQTSSSFTISNTGTGLLNWAASTAQSWISFNPTNDSTRTEIDIISVNVNRSGLSPNTYNGTITINSNGGSQSIQVQMVVVATPTLSLSTTHLDFDSTQTQKSFVISNQGSGTLNWNVAGNQNWMTVNPQSGTNQGTVNVTISRSGLSNGSYSGIVTIVSDGGNGSVNVLMKVTPPPPPAAVTLGKPTNITTSSITLGWTKSTESNFTAYRIYADTTPAITENSKLLTTITNKDQNSYTATGLSSGTTYYFRVFVMNTNQATAGSNTVSGTTQVQLKSWSVLSTPSMVNVDLFSIDALSSNFVYIGGDDGKMFFYNGSTWYRDSMPTTGTIKDLKIITQTNAWAVGNSVYHYDGISWVVPSDAPSLDGSSCYSIDALDASHVWIGSYGKIAFYNGSSWSTTSINAKEITDIQMVDSNNGWALSSDGKVYYYNGSGWSVYTTAPLSGYLGDGYSISVNNPSDIWVVSANGYSHGATHFDGSDWTNYTFSSSLYIYSVQFLAPNDGWFVEYSGKIYHYDGTAWNSISSPTTNHLFRIKMINSTDGWAVGYNGVVLRYH
jgi:hypothetical protein